MSSRTPLYPGLRAAKPILTFLAGFLAIAIAWLSFHVTEDLLSLRRTPHSDMIGAGTQLESQFHRFVSSLSLAQTGRATEADIDRQWLGLQGWEPMLTAGVIYDTFRDDPAFRDLAGEITNGLQDIQQLATSNDGWIAASPRILDRTAALTPAFHRLSIYCIQQVDDVEQRQEARILRDVRFLSAVIILLFIVLAAAALLTQLQARQLRRAGQAIDMARLEAERASRAKSDFVAHMSHEFRTPLNAIIGFSEAIHAEIFGPVGHPRYREYCADVVTAGRHLHGLIDAILDLSRIESGKLEIAPAEIEPLALARVCLDLVRPQATKKSIQLSLNARPDFPKLRADPRHLRQILLNLLSNAVKFTPSGGQVELAIEIDATDAQSQIVFHVKDNGIGIAPEDIGRVQRPFGRVARRMGQAQDGTGLGLSISKSLAEANGASFHLSSVKGSGTTATILFPLSPQATTSRPLNAVTELSS